MDVTSGTGEQPDVLVIEEVAALRDGLSVPSVFRLIADSRHNGFPSKKVGRARRFSRRKVMEWLEEQSQPKARRK